MANWVSRVVLATAVCVLAPISARLAVSGAAVGGQQAAPSQVQHSGAPKNNLTRTQPTRKTAVKGEATRTDLIDPLQAKSLSETETLTDFRRTLCGFLVLYAENPALPNVPAPRTTRETYTIKLSERARPKASQTQEPAGGVTEGCTDPVEGNVEVMIAILPDPVRTHLSLRFDRAVDDVENAAQQLGWVFDKAWLPWRNDQGPAPNRMQERYIDEQMQQSRDEQPGLLLFRKARSKRPLVVLVVGDTPTEGVDADQFRNAIRIWRGMHTKPFRVSDCPIAGKTKDAPDACLLRQRLMILGPSFSGSAPSLKRLLMEESNRGAVANVDVVTASGTMTSSHLLTDLTSEDSGAPNLSVNATSFAADVTYTRARLLEFLDTHLPRRESGIAELTEDESQFGGQTQNPEEDLIRLKLELVKTLKLQQQLSKPIGGDQDDKRTKDFRRVLRRQTELSEEIRRLQNFLYFFDGLTNGTKRQGSLDISLWRSPFGWLKTKNEKVPKNSGQCVSEKYTQLLDDRKEFLDCSAKRPQGRPYLQLTFPREISVLRKAYEQNGIIGFGAGVDSNVPKTQLRLSFAENSTNGDAVPLFAGAQSASSMENRMAAIAATLEKEKIAVVVLSATDVLDDIFVARFLHEHAPSVTIVIQDADLLFLRGGATASLDGAYVVSPYPLIPKNGQWSADMDSPLQPSPVLAPSQGDEGLLNAATYLLCGGDRNASVSFAGQNCGWKPRKDFLAPGYLWMNEYEPPIPVTRSTDNDYKLQPPLWLSVIAHGSFQPVGLIDLDNRNKLLPESSELSLPRLGEVLVDKTTNMDYQVWDTNPAGIQDEPIGEMCVCLAILLLVLGLHAYACLRCRLDRSFAWSYATADEKPWLTRMMIQVGLNLLGIYGLSLLLLHDFPGFHMEPVSFKIIVVAAQVLLVVLSAVVALRSAVRRKRADAPNNIAKGGSGEAKSRETEAEHEWEKDVHWAISWAALAGSALFTVLVDCIWWRWFGPPAEEPGVRTFFWYRSAYLLSGASPTLPLLLLGTALALWLRSRLAKLVFYGYRIPKLPSVGTEFRCPCDDSMRDLNRLLGSPMWEWDKNGTFLWNEKKLQVALTSFALVGGVLMITRQLGPHSLAWSWFDGLVDVLAFTVAVGTVHNLLVSLLAWRMLQGECLVPLRQSQLRWGFNWIRGFSWRRLCTSPEGFTAEAEFEYVIRNVQADSRGKMADRESEVRANFAALLECYGSHDRAMQCEADCESGWEWLTSPIRWIRTSAWRARRSADWAEKLASRSSTLYRALAQESNDRLDSLSVFWQSDVGPVTGRDAARGLHNGGTPMELNEPERSKALQRIADEEFVAMVYLTYIRSVLVQIRNRVATSAMLYVLLLWALSGYVWMNRHGILLQMCALLVVLAAVAVTIYSQLHRDDILSRTTETATGKLDGEFFTKVLSVVGIPALTLLATQFPEFSNAIFSWLVPGLSNVR